MDSPVWGGRHLGTVPPEPPTGAHSGGGLALGGGGGYQGGPLRLWRALCPCPDPRPHSAGPIWKQRGADGHMIGTPQRLSRSADSLPQRTLAHAPAPVGPAASPRALPGPGGVRGTRPRSGRRTLVSPELQEAYHISFEEAKLNIDPDSPDEQEVGLHVCLSQTRQQLKQIPYGGGGGGLWGGAGGGGGGGGCGAGQGWGGVA